MPIPAVCPTCLARLSAPDEASGKRVKCPKCQNPVAVPRADSGRGVVETDDWPIRPPRRGDRGRRGRSDRGAGVPVAWVVAGAAIFLLLIAGGGLAALYFLRPEPAPPPPVAGPPPAPEPVKPAPAAPQPVKWVAFDSKATHYTASFPNKAPNKVESLDQFTGGIDPKQLAEALGPEWSKELGLGTGSPTTADRYAASDGGRRYVIDGMINPGGLGPVLDPAKLLTSANALAAQSYPGAEVESAADLKVAGYPARHLVLRHGVRTVLARYIAAGDHFFTLRVEGDAEMKADDPTAKEFFDKFKPYPPKKR